MRSLRKAILVLAILISSGASGAAQDVTVTEAWARAPIGPGLPIQVFFTVTNMGNTEDDLVEARARFARMEDILTTVERGNPDTYALAAPVRIPQQSQVQFRPGGMLVALNMLNEPIIEGDDIRLTLIFREAGAITVEIPVLGPFAGGL
jgi:copper(I)-binding protein